MKGKDRKIDETLEDAYRWASATYSTEASAQVGCVRSIALSLWAIATMMHEGR